MMQDGETYEDFRIAVPTGYENVFSHFYFAQNRTKETITKTLLPSYQTMLIFSFGKKALVKSTNNRRVKVDKCVVLGTNRRAFDYLLPPRSEGHTSGLQSRGNLLLRPLAVNKK